MTDDIRPLIFDPEHYPEDKAVQDKLKVHFSTGKDNWETPDDFFDGLNTHYHFVLDAAADSHNTKCVDYFGPDSPHAVDALEADWVPWLEKGNIWLNPPYSRTVQPKFVKKALSEFRKYAVPMGYNYRADEAHHVVILLPARTDTKLFHEVIQPCGEIEFIKGRLKFKGAKASAPFPSMIVVF